MHHQLDLNLDFEQNKRSVVNCQLIDTKNLDMNTRGESFQSNSTQEWQLNISQHSICKGEYFLLLSSKIKNISLYLSADTNLGFVKKL